MVGGGWGRVVGRVVEDLFEGVGGVGSFCLGGAWLGARGEVGRCSFGAVGSGGEGGGDGRSRGKVVEWSGGGGEVEGEGGEGKGVGGADSWGGFRQRQLERRQHQQGKLGFRFVVRGFPACSVSNVFLLREVETLCFRSMAITYSHSISLAYYLHLTHVCFSFSPSFPCEHSVRAPQGINTR